MPGKRPNEPIAPTNIPGQPLDPKIPPEQQADNEDFDDDDEVGTDEQGNEMLRATPHGAPANVSSDRVVPVDAEPGDTAARAKSPPLKIQEIENLEDDAKGG
jgi:hypothetical protein